MGFMDDYEPVEDRIAKFYAEHAQGSIITRLEKADSGEFIVFASVFREGEEAPWATGLAREILTERGINSTSALEVCETSAIGRALANAGYAAKGKRPSREEMGKTVAPETITLDQEETLVGLLDEIGYYPETWKAERLPDKKTLELLPASKFDHAFGLLQGELNRIASEAEF